MIERAPFEIRSPGSGLGKSQQPEKITFLLSLCDHTGKMTRLNYVVSGILSHSRILNPLTPEHRIGSNQLRWPFLTLQVISYCIFKKSTRVSYILLVCCCKMCISFLDIDCIHYYLDMSLHPKGGKYISMWRVDKRKCYCIQTEKHYTLFLKYCKGWYKQVIAYRCV